MPLILSVGIRAVVFYSVTVSVVVWQQRSRYHHQPEHYDKSKHEEFKQLIIPHIHVVYVPFNLPLANLQIGWPICQSQIGQPICKWDYQSENLFEVSFPKFSRHAMLSHTLLLFELMVSTEVSRIEC